MPEEPEKNNPPLLFLIIGTVLVALVLVWVFIVFSGQHSYDNPSGLKDAQGVSLHAPAVKDLNGNLFELKDEFTA